MNYNLRITKPIGKDVSRVIKFFDLPATEAVKQINSVNDGKATINKTDLNNLKTEMTAFVVDVLGILGNDKKDDRLSPVMDLVLDLRNEARINKDWTTSDKIRDGLAAAGIVVKDSKDGSVWN